MWCNLANVPALEPPDPGLVSEVLLPGLARLLVVARRHVAAADQDLAPRPRPVRHAVVPLLPVDQADVDAPGPIRGQHW